MGFWKTILATAIGAVIGGVILLLITPHIDIFKIWFVNRGWSIAVGMIIGGAISWKMMQIWHFLKWLVKAVIRIICTICRWLKIIFTINKLDTQLKSLKNEISEIEAMSHFCDPRDNQIYKIVKIGNRWWFAENLRYKEQGSVCLSSDNNGKKYGMFYNWEMAKIACPAGWHLPSNDEWQTLVERLGGIEIAGEKLKAKECSGTDDYGFYALLGGYCLNHTKNINLIGQRAIWWTSQKDLQCIEGKRCYKYRDGAPDVNLFNIRCARD